MRTLIVTQYISLARVVDSPSGGGHPPAGWTFNEVERDPAAYEIKGREQAEAGAPLMGRVSYQEFAPVWPSLTEDSAGYKAMPRYVVSTTRTETEPGWQPTVVLRSLADVARLKQEEGAPIIVNGSPTLAQGLAAGLLDHYHLPVLPGPLGAGKRLFDTGPYAEPGQLALVEHAADHNGVTVAVYDIRRNQDAS